LRIQYISPLFCIKQGFLSRQNSPELSTQSTEYGSISPLAARKTGFFSNFLWRSVETKIEQAIPKLDSPNLKKKEDVKKKIKRHIKKLLLIQDYSTLETVLYNSDIAKSKEARNIICEAISEYEPLVPLKWTRRWSEQLEKLTGITSISYYADDMQSREAGRSLIKHMNYFNIENNICLFRPFKKGSSLLLIGGGRSPINSQLQEQLEKLKTRLPVVQKRLQIVKKRLQIVQKRLKAAQGQLKKEGVQLQVVQKCLLEKAKRLQAVQKRLQEERKVINEAMKPTVTNIELVYPKLNPLNETEKIAKDFFNPENASSLEC
jgi:hypothetical protein